MSEVTIKVEISGLEGLVQAILALAGKNGTGYNEPGVTPNMGTIGAAAPVTSPVTPAYAAPVTPQNVPVSPAQAYPQPPLPVQQMPVQTPARGVPATGLPTTAMPQEFTQDQLSVAAAGLVNQGKQPRLLELLHNFGVNSLVELPKERYGEFATALRAEGAVI